MGRRKQALDVGITIAQHNSLVNARYYMDVMEMKTFIYLLSKIKKTDKQFKLTKIPLKYFMPKEIKK